MTGDEIVYAADGLTMRSKLFLPTGLEAPRPAVLLFPEAFGLGEQVKARARQLAALGYTALACDLHGEGRRFAEGTDVRPLLEPLKNDPSRIRARAEAARAALACRPEADATRMAAVGYCFGGTMALEFARSGAAIAATVGFHSGLSTVAQKDARAIAGRVLVCIGADDPGIPPDQRAVFESEMREGGVEWQMLLLGGVVHSFTNPDAYRMGVPEFARYDANADAQSWSAMLQLFGEVFGSA